MADSTRKHYQALYRELVKTHGPLDKEITGAIVGFDAGGPVALASIEKRKLYVTRELTLYPGQQVSDDGLRFELLSIDAFDLETCRVLLTAIGNLSMAESLGDGHTVGLGDLLGPGQPSKVRLSLFSQAEIDGEKYGIYQVLPA